MSVSKSIRMALVATSLLTFGSAVSAQHNAPTALRPIRLEAPRNPNAPNILIVLTDDVGFGAASTFGGPIPAPALDALAAQGLKYNRFHTTAMCSPTRAALLTGRNHHRVNMGSIVNLANGEPGYSGILPKNAATIGKVLQLNGYSTAWFGKDHVTPQWELNPAGPFDRWPTGLGFDYFYGFMDGASDQFAPSLVENTRPVDPSKGDGYILDRDLADHAVGWIREHQSVAPDKPFLIYFATGTAHEPHQAPMEWIARFKGRFDQGWDKVREESFARQKAMGIIPGDTVLTPRPDILPAWDSLSPDEKRVAARLMEVHAAQRAYFDDQFGRVVEALKQTGKWDNTLVIFVDGDNGASGEGGPEGGVVHMLNPVREPLAYRLAKLDDLGGPLSSENYAAGWAWAMDTPFQYFKQIASHLGGIRDGMVISWPSRIRRPGGIRTQFGHVNDIAPTIYEAAGIKPPAVVDGVPQMPLDGVSLLYSMNDAAAPSRHRSQYFEMLGNLAFYEDGWLASRVPPNVMWAPARTPTKSWQLFNLDKDYSQSRDVSAVYPAKLKALQEGFDHARIVNGFRVLDASFSARIAPGLQPSIMDGRTDFRYFRTDRPLLDEEFPDILNRAWSMTVSVEVETGRDKGTLVSQGGYPYGWGLYVFDGIPTFLYRNEPTGLSRLAWGKPLRPGRHVIALKMAPESGRPGAAATVSLAVDGEPAAVQRLPSTVAAYFGSNGVGIGRDVGKAISDEVVMPFAFAGTMGPIDIHFDQ